MLILLTDVHMPVHSVLRQIQWTGIGESDRLWLEREPLAKEVIDEFAKFNMEEL